MTDFPDDIRGSTRLLEAWDTRARHVVTDSDIKQIAARLDESPAELRARGHQRRRAAQPGWGIALNYDGDDPQCGNDLQWLIELLRKLGGRGSGSRRS